MSDNLTTTLLKEELRTGPWHRLGFQTNDSVNLNEALILGGLNWTAKVEPLYLRGGKRLTNRSAIVRSDNRSVLSVVGSQYRPIQHVEAAEVIERLSDFKAWYTSAGTLSGGRKYWFLSEQIQLRWRGTVGQILLTGGHDSSAVVRMHLVALQSDLVLLPGIRLPDPGLSHGRKTRALPRYWSKDVTEAWEKLTGQYHTLRSTEISHEQFGSLAELAARPGRAGRTEVEELLRLYHNHDKTALGALITVCHYVDQERTRFSAPRSLRAADESALLGKGAAVKETWKKMLLKHCDIQ